MSSTALYTYIITHSLYIEIFKLVELFPNANTNDFLIKK